MSSDMDNLKQILDDFNIKPSHHRIRILEYLLENKFHPTADAIHSSLVKEIPTLSKTTVYNTLNLFAQSNLVKVLSIDDVEARYDISTDNHGHFRCKSCGEIFDIQLDSVSLVSDELANFQIQEQNVYFSGICPKCLVD